MKKAIKLTFVVAICLIAANLYSLSDGAFNMTSAPGEGDCSACHSGANPNSDTKGSISIAVDSSNGFYEPGKSYPVRVTLSYSGKTRFGFALTTRQTGSVLHIGSFSSTPSSGVMNRNEFVAHTRASIDAPNQKTWSFRWQAPNNINGDITLYAAGIAANANNDNTGDLVYTNKIVLKKAANTGVVEFGSETKKLEVYPMPTGNIIWIKDVEEMNIDKAVLMDTKGNAVRTYQSSDFSNDNRHSKLCLGDDIAPGIYILNIKYGEQSVYAKIVIAR